MHNRQGAVECRVITSQYQVRLVDVVFLTNEVEPLVADELDVNVKSLVTLHQIQAFCQMYIMNKN